MHAKPDLRVFLKWMITRSGSVITDVIPLRASLKIRFTIRTILLAILLVSIGTAWWLDSTQKSSEIQKQQEILDQRNWHSWQRYMALADSTSLEHALGEQQETYGKRVLEIYSAQNLGQKDMADLSAKHLKILSQEIETCSHMLSQYVNRPNSNPEQEAIKKQIALYEQFAAEARENGK